MKKIYDRISLVRGEGGGSGRALRGQSRGLGRSSKRGISAMPYTRCATRRFFGWILNFFFVIPLSSV